MSRPRGECRTFLELLKTHAGNAGWTLEQMADFWDAYMAIRKEYPNTVNETDFGPLPVTAVPGPKGKQ